MITGLRLNWIVALTLGFMIPLPAFSAQETPHPVRDAEDVFMRAYVFYREGEKFESESKDLEALERYLKSQGLFAYISNKYATWRPEMIGYRRKILAEKIEAVMQKISGQKPKELPRQAPEAKTSQELERLSAESEAQKEALDQLNQQVEDLRKKLEATEEKLLQQQAELKRGEKEPGN